MDDINIMREMKRGDKAIKKEIRATKLYSTKVGDRTLTPAQKRNDKKGAGYRCARCKRKFSFEEAQDYLQVHHKKSVASHKDKFLGVDIPIVTFGKKHIPKYGRRKSNREVLCIKCHKFIEKKRHKRKAAQRKKQKAWWNTL